MLLGYDDHLLLPSLAQKRGTRHAHAALPIITDLEEKEGEAWTYVLPMFIYFFFVFHFG